MQVSFACLRFLFLLSVCVWFLGSTMTRAFHAHEANPPFSGFVDQVRGGRRFITRVCVYDYARWIILEEGFFLWENTVDKSEALSPNTPTG